MTETPHGRDSVEYWRVRHALATAALTAALAREAALREALEEADHARISLYHYAYRAHAGDVDAGGRELKRQVLLKFGTFEKAYAAATVQP